MTHELKPGRAAFIHIATGAATVNGTPLVAGDGAAIENESTVTIGGDKVGEVLVFDLA